MHWAGIRPTYRQIHVDFIMFTTFLFKCIGLGSAQQCFETIFTLQDICQMHWAGFRPMLSYEKIPAYIYVTILILNTFMHWAGFRPTIKRITKVWMPRVGFHPTLIETRFTIRRHALNALGWVLSNILSNHFVHALMNVRIPILNVVFMHWAGFHPIITHLPKFERLGLDSAQ